MIVLRRSMRLATLCCAVTVTLLAQTRPAAPRTPRIYIFENGAIKGLDVALFNFKREEIKTKLLNDEDFDVFGDGAVIVKSAPGHTPGHQVVYVKLAMRGPVLLAGDLYHYPEERTTGRIPTFEFNAEQSRAARQKIEAFVKQTKAELWIEHDIATHATLPKAPAYIE